MMIKLIMEASDTVAPDEQHRLPIEHQIEFEINRMFSRAVDGDTVLFYFSGHGCVKNGHAFLVAKDTRWNNLGSPGKGIRIGDVRTKLENCKASRKIVIIDACHSGEGISKSGESLDNDFPDSFGDFGHGTAVLSSCKKSERSYILKDQSVFTKYLLEGVDGNAQDISQGGVTLFSLAGFIKKQVVRWAENQHPPRNQTPTLWFAGDADGLMLVPGTSHKAAETSEKQKGPQLYRFEETRPILTLSLFLSRYIRWGNWYSYPMEGHYGGVLLPLVPIGIGSASRHVDVNGIIDTGAALNVIPKEIAHILGLRESGFFEVMGFDFGEMPLKQYPKFHFEVAVAGKSVKVEGLGAARETVLLGRPFLKHFTLVLDFENERTLLRPRKRFKEPGK